MMDLYLLFISMIYCLFLLSVWFGLQVLSPMADDSPLFYDYFLNVNTWIASGSQHWTLNTFNHLEVCI